MLILATPLSWAQTDNFIKESDLKSEKIISGIGFSVTVPAGWSYLNADNTKKPIESRGDYRMKRTSTAEILITPTSDIADSEVYLSVRNFFPQASDIVALHRLYKDEGAKLTAKRWDGHEWKILEYTSTYQDADKKKKTRYSWYATTHIKDGDLAITAVTPPEKRDQFRAQFETMMKSVKVVSP